MDPHYEQILRDEVIDLHSLWHHHQNPHSNPTHILSTPLQIPKSTPAKFKKQKKKPKHKKIKKIPPQSNPPHTSDTEWPCPNFPDPPPSAFEWPVLKLNPGPSTRLPTAEEQARFAATQVQQKALTSAQGFFVDSDSDDDCAGGGGSDDDEDDLMEEDEYEEYKFFVKVFDEDGELRGYYVENCERGEFCCLVCGGIGKKVGKRFKGCVALVQHSNGIAKTKKRKAHRAFAQVVCKVLGWDIDKLPTSGLSLAKSGECQGNAEFCMEDLNIVNQNRVSDYVSSNGEVILKEVSNVGQGEDLQISTVLAMSSGVGSNVMLIESHLKVDDADMRMENLDSSYLGWANGMPEIVVNCPSSLKVGDANVCMENHDCGDLSMADGKAEGVVNCLCRNLSKTVVLETT
ncbi:hypothetical protein Vadar_024145 [Vaccinium darrowii]|uniref:Uncharacterized protein n=1 Tax=Vaccinium darrowii TaxID=229202 RepID=A0ACB7Z5Z0_9ERIC|nr:hypothetical protein Vadar_024145 [Vaccinium darrowii]